MIIISAKYSSVQNVMFLYWSTSSWLKVMGGRVWQVVVGGAQCDFSFDIKDFYY